MIIGGNMDRRNASKLILTGSLAAPALIQPTPLLANPLKENERDARIAEFARPTIRFAAQSVVLKWFLLPIGGQWLAMNLQREFRQYNENRASLGGLLGQRQRPTVDQRIAAASTIGALYLISSSMVFLPSNRLSMQQFEANLRQMEFVLFHRYFSMDLEAAFRVASLGNRTPESIRAEGRAIGLAFATSTLLSVMLAVNPVAGKTYRLGS